VIPAFREEARGETSRASRVLVSGPHIGMIEYYLDRKPLRVRSPRDAWTQAEPGDAVLVSGSRRSPIPRDEFRSLPTWSAAATRSSAPSISGERSDNCLRWRG